jgi:tetratricopeptide (TPR) repeat protein
MEVIPNPPEQTPVRKLSSLKRVIRYSVGVAASIILVAGALFAFNFYRLSSAKVYTGHYQPYELGTTRTVESDENIFEKEYREKNFKGMTVVKENAVTPRDQFLVALAYMELRDYPSAIEHFRKLIGRKPVTGMNMMKEESEYYLALAYIRNKDFDLALELLHSIHDNPDHLYNKKVTSKLIRQVKLLKWR